MFSVQLIFLVNVCPPLERNLHLSPEDALGWYCRQLCLVSFKYSLRITPKSFSYRSIVSRIISLILRINWNINDPDILSVYPQFWMKLVETEHKFDWADQRSSFCQNMLKWGSIVFHCPFGVKTLKSYRIACQQRTGWRPNIILRFNRKSICNENTFYFIFWRRTGLKSRESYGESDKNCQFFEISHISSVFFLKCYTIRSRSRLETWN